MKQYLCTWVAIVLVAALGNSRDALAADTDEKKTEVEGSWKFIKGGKGAPQQITFSGNELVINLGEERVFKGTFKIDTNQTPSEMDIKIVSAPMEKHKGKVVLCIYKFDGENLTWCASAPGRKRRPQLFAEVMGDARLLFGTYKLEKK